MSWIANLLLGGLPLLILGASWAAGTKDDRGHRVMFLFVYGLWALTLALWNWMRSAAAVWIVLWLAMGVMGLGLAYAFRSRA